MELSFRIWFSWTAYKKVKHSCFYFFLFLTLAYYYSMEIITHTVHTEIQVCSKCGIIILPQLSSETLLTMQTLLLDLLYLGKLETGLGFILTTLNWDYSKFSFHSQKTLDNIQTNYFKSRLYSICVYLVHNPAVDKVGWLK